MKEWKKKQRKEGGRGDAVSPRPPPPCLAGEVAIRFGKPLQKNLAQEQVRVHAREEPETRVMHSRLGSHLQTVVNQKDQSLLWWGAQSLEPGVLCWTAESPGLKLGREWGKPRTRASLRSRQRSPAGPRGPQSHPEPGLPPMPTGVTIAALIVVHAFIDFNNLGWGAGTWVGGAEGGEEMQPGKGVQVEVVGGGHGLHSLG